MSYRDNASYGKRQEFKAIAKLLELGHDVYSTLVDNIGIDYIIRVNHEQHLDIQIKARSVEGCIPKHRGFFPQISIEHPRDNYLGGDLFVSDDQAHLDYQWSALLGVYSLRIMKDKSEQIAVTLPSMKAIVDRENLPQLRKFLGWVEQGQLNKFLERKLGDD